MKTVEKIIRENGGMRALRRNKFLKVRNNRGEILEIQSMGPGPGDWEAVAVSFYDLQSEDTIGNPRMCFEIVRDSPWLPYYFRDDSVGEELCAYAVKEHLALINMDLVEFEGFGGFPAT